MTTPGDITEQDLENAVIIPVEAYISEDYARAERDKLSRKVWQQVGRIEEIPEVGDFLTYEVLDDLILIVRAAEDDIPRLSQCLPASRSPASWTRRRARATPPASAGSSLAPITAGVSISMARIPASCTRRIGRAR